MNRSIYWPKSGLQFAAAICCLLALENSGLAIVPHAKWFPRAVALPKPDGPVIHVSTVEQLYRAVANVRPGETILIADGSYMLPRYLQINTDRVTLRSATGHRDRVVLDGANSRHGELVGVGKCRGVIIADLTIQNAKWNGFKINSNLGAQEVAIHNCVIHNIWQRGIKGPSVPQQEGTTARGVARCRIQYCLFYNDRPKRFSDDEADTARNFNGNYIGGIDVMNTIDWTISDNVFIGIQGRTREGRAAIFVWRDSQGCLIERNTMINCDVAIALGNPSRGKARRHATNCTVRNNLVVNCPETGILACLTRGCRILENTVVEPESRLGRLIWVHDANDGLEIKDNLLVGAQVRVRPGTAIEQQNNRQIESLDESKQARGGQTFLDSADTNEAIRFARQRTGAMKRPGETSSAVVSKSKLIIPSWVPAMQQVHSGFRGNPGYVAQFGDSITYSMAFWSPLGWDNPQQYLTAKDGLPKTPPGRRWRDVIRGAADKGPKFANYSGWRAGQVLRSMGAVLKREKPEVAIIMVGSNDISGGRVPPNYRADLVLIVQTCLDAHCVPILNTIPPRRGRQEVVGQANTIIREVAKDAQIPMVDYYAACLDRRPGDSWDGTLISKDGVHPSGGMSNVYSEENMKHCGYALRNWVNFLMLRQVYFHVLTAKSSKPIESPQLPGRKGQSPANQKTKHKLESKGATFPVHSPRVLSPHVADAYSMRTFSRYHDWDGLRGDELAYAVYKYLADTRTGLFHMNVVAEGPDRLGEFSQIRDPVKLINVYGYAYCGILGPVMAGVCEQMGIGPSRTVTLPGWSHVAAETYYDGAWHYLDADVRAVFRTRSGSLASLEQARQDPNLWRDRGPLFFPNDPLDATRQIYQKTRVEYYHGFQQSGHTMDYVLRPGERFTRWWKPQGERWHHLPLYHQQPWLRRLIESDPRGPKPNHRHFSIHNHGNGCFVYQPDLTSKSHDFERGIHDQHNLVVTDDGLMLRAAGAGEAIFAVRSPYVIVPVVGELDTTDDDESASVIQFDGRGVSCSLSTDNGLTWTTLPEEASRHDLTSHVSGKYGYLLKVSLRGDGNDAILRSLKLTTWVQLAPASLPALRRGVNRMEFLTGDHYGMNTSVSEIRSHASRPELFLKYLAKRPTEYDPQRSTSKIKGEFIARLTAPPGTKIAWFNATAQFRTYQGDAARRTKNSIGYAEQEQGPFRTIYEANVPTYVNHWHYNAGREVRLKKPVKKLLVRYVGAPAINNFAIYAHCLSDRPSSSRTPVQITHTWREEGRRKSKSVSVVAGDGNYTIDVSGEPLNESIVLAVESSRR